MQIAKDGHEIGNHTTHHCHAKADGTLQSCATATAGDDFDSCTSLITSTLGVSHVWSAASPYGDTGYSAPASERFFLNRGVWGGSVGPNDNSDPFNLPVWGPNENDTVTPFNTVIDSAHAAGKWVIVLLHSIAPTTNRWFATVDISSITGSISHAKSLGDVWLDTMTNVGAYWRAQTLFAGLKPAISGTTQTWSWTLPPHFPTGKFLRVKVDGGTLSQAGKTLVWDEHGYHEVALDGGSLTLSP
jgi:hypothetical protein